MAPARIASPARLGHAGQVVGGRRLVVGAPFVHHVGAQRAVRKLRGDVDRTREAVEGVEVLGEGLPLPRDALVQRGAGNVLHALHELDQELVAVAAHRRESDAAVAEHRGGDSVPARRREQRVPRDLAVEVGVRVDEPRGDEQPVGVDLPRAPPGPASIRPTSVICPPSIPMSAVRAGAPVPSTTVPPLITSSCCMRHSPGRSRRVVRDLSTVEPSVRAPARNSRWQ